MKIIDLFNMISQDKEIPKRIKINGLEYERQWSDYCGDEPICDLYIAVDEYNFKTLKDFCLNNEVEIIEEEKKIPEKLIPTSLKGIDNLDEKIEIAHIDTISVIETLNQLIDFLKSKGE